MTEAEWLTCTDPSLMLGFVKGNTSDRKLRLFACASCYFICHHLLDDNGRRALEVAEQYADGLTGEDERSLAVQQATRGVTVEDMGDRWEARYHAWTAAGACSQIDAFDAAIWSHKQTVSSAVTEADPFLPDDGPLSPVAAFTKQATRSQLCNLLRDIFGNPLRRYELNSHWLTLKVTDLATAVYDARAFERMRLLADTLIDAGCDNKDVLEHCRSPGIHARGCWVVDLLLGKK